MHEEFNSRSKIALIMVILLFPLGLFMSVIIVGIQIGEIIEGRYFQFMSHPASWTIIILTFCGLFLMLYPVYYLLKYINYKIIINNSEFKIKNFVGKEKIYNLKNMKNYKIRSINTRKGKLEFLVIYFNNNAKCIIFNDLNNDGFKKIIKIVKRY